jgi:hypothetical protein
MGPPGLSIRGKDGLPGADGIPGKDGRDGEPGEKGELYIYTIKFIK